MDSPPEDPDWAALLAARDGGPATGTLAPLFAPLLAPALAA